mmetsp:Transcript_12180/g.36998  ORF Transcript_12180/g.36998 Transcript_12180/m.36998 type:complete len:109 (-) Transcript_12180:31-357(-)
MGSEEVAALAGEVDASFRSLVEAKRGDDTEATERHLRDLVAASGRLEELLASIEKRAEGVSLSSDEAALAAKLKRKLEVIGKARGLAGTWDERLEGLIKDKEAVLQKV